MQVNQIQIIKDAMEALQEDIGAGDVTSALIPENLEVEAEIISREPMLVCGQPWVNAVFSSLDQSIQIYWLVSEGAWLDKASTLCKIKGRARSILTAERTALNFLQTLSGTATKTYHYVLELKPFETKLLDTRKTLPKLRYAQKYAVACAGASNHRHGLYDAFLIKENHIKSAGSITAALKQARSLNKDLFLEVEVETLEELSEALHSKPDRILLDNFSYEMLKQAIKLNEPKICKLEVSGGLNLTNITQIAELGIDYLSVGAITKSLEAIDLSLNIRTKK